MTNEYLTVYRGGRDQRQPRPFSQAEEDHIKSLMKDDMEDLYYLIGDLQAWPRHQRIVQEAIERKRRNGAA